VAASELLTTRLRLRPRTVDDVEANLAMDLDPEVHRYIFVQGAPETEAWRKRLLERIESGWPAEGGLWVVEWRHRPGFLGWCGIFPLEESGLIELGYRYTRAAWGQGVATEAAGAVLEHGFRELKLDPIVAVAHPDNVASRRVLEKLGFQHQGRARYYGTEVAYYRLDRSRYLAAGPGLPTNAQPAARAEHD
jgi:RimJ/RimL family protein N-acetyltransferase